jgi:hypothetical protein
MFLLFLKKMNPFMLFAGKPEGYRPLVIPRNRWVDDIKMDLAEIIWAGVNWIGLVQDLDNLRRLVKAAMNLRVS